QLKVTKCPATELEVINRAFVKSIKSNIAEISDTARFKVKACDEEPEPKAILDIVKDVRKAGTKDSFLDTVNTKPGQKVEYRLTIRNLDGKGIARNLRVKDMLPAGLTYVGPTKL